MGCTYLVLGSGPNISCENFCARGNRVFGGKKRKIQKQNSYLRNDYMDYRSSYLIQKKINCPNGRILRHRRIRV